MEYKVKVVYKQFEVSDKEKLERVNQFQQAFVTAAVDYYASKLRIKSTIIDKN